MPERADQQGENAERERDVGGRRNGPPGGRDGVPPVDGKVERGRDGHAAGRRDARQRRLGHRGQLAAHHLALDLQADEQKENRHQAVVDPMEQRFREADVPEKERHLGPQQAEIDISPRRVHPHHGDGGRNDEKDAAGRLEFHELQESLGGQKHDVRGSRHSASFWLNLYA